MQKRDKLKSNRTFETLKDLESMQTLEVFCIYRAFLPVRKLYDFTCIAYTLDRDIGSRFDLFSELSHTDHRGFIEERVENRMLLQHVMVRNGFRCIDCEWRHCCLENEPYPDTYFHFPVSSACPIAHLKSYGFQHINNKGLSQNVNRFVILRNEVTKDLYSEGFCELSDRDSSLRSE